MPAEVWTNWFGNQRCRPRHIFRPTDEAQLSEIVSRATSEGETVRVAGGGHSLPPVVVTDGVLVDLSDLGGTIDTDPDTKTFTAPGGALLADTFDPLWDAGLALANMGELATGTLAGTISTGAHGTGLTLPCTSASVRGVRLVTASGEVVDIGDDQPDLLRAARMSVGMLGVITRVEMGVVAAYELHERSRPMSVDEAVEEWDDLVAAHRHFSFYYLANNEAAAAFADQLAHLPDDAADLCLATIIDAVAPGDATPIGEHERRDRMDRILTIEFDPNYREIEFAVPLEVGKETFVELRERLMTTHPSYAYPINVRFVAEDDSLLSPFHGGPKTVFSVSEHPDAAYETVLADVEQLFYSKGGLPHWGKEHTLDVATLSRLQPGFERFREIRRELDPTGTFLNPHLRELFA